MPMMARFLANGNYTVYETVPATIIRPDTIVERNFLTIPDTELVETAAPSYDTPGSPVTKVPMSKNAEEVKPTGSILPKNPDNLSIGSFVSKNSENPLSKGFPRMSSAFFVNKKQSPYLNSDIESLDTEEKCQDKCRTSTIVGRILCILFAVMVLAAIVSVVYIEIFLPSPSSRRQRFLESFTAEAQGLTATTFSPTDDSTTSSSQTTTSLPLWSDVYQSTQTSPPETLPVVTMTSVPLMRTQESFQKLLSLLKSEGPLQRFPRHITKTLPRTIESFQKFLSVLRFE